MLIEALKNNLHETGKDFPYRDEIIEPSKEALNMAIAGLKAWSNVREQLIDEKEFAYADFDEYKRDVLGIDDIDDLPDDDFRYGMERAIDIIDKQLREV